MIFKTKYLANLLWIVWFDYMEIREWLLGVGYDVYYSVVYFLLTWIVRNNMMLLNYMIKSMLVNTHMLIDCDIVGEYIYVEWLWYGWWIHICWLIVILSVNAYMLRDGDFVGDCIYAKWMMMTWWWLLIELWLDWLCGRKYLIMQLLLKLINVNGGVLLHCCWWIFMLEILHYWVFACMSMHHSHIESYEKCKMRFTFT